MRVWDCLLVEGVKTEERIHIADGFYLETLPSDMSGFPRSLYFHVFPEGPYSEEKMSAKRIFPQERSVQRKFGFIL